MTKYHNEVTDYGGIRFDSKKESARYGELKIMEKRGIIHNLQRQVRYELIPKQSLPTPVRDQKNKNWRYSEKAVIYKADFVYEKDGQTVVEDVKGYRTHEYKIKRKLMLYVHGIQVMEV